LAKTLSEDFWSHVADMEARMSSLQLHAAQLRDAGASLRDSALVIARALGNGELLAAIEGLGSSDAQWFEVGRMALASRPAARADAAFWSSAVKEGSADLRTLPSLSVDTLVITLADLRVQMKARAHLFDAEVDALASELAISGDAKAIAASCSGLRAVLEEALTPLARFIESRPVDNAVELYGELYDRLETLRTEFRGIVEEIAQGGYVPRLQAVGCHSWAIQSRLAEAARIALPAASRSTHVPREGAQLTSRNMAREGTVRCAILTPAQGRDAFFLRDVQRLEEVCKGARRFKCCVQDAGSEGESVFGGYADVRNFIFEGTAWQARHGGVESVSAAIAGGAGLIAGSVNVLGDHGQGGVVFIKTRKGKTFSITVDDLDSLLGELDAAVKWEVEMGVAAVDAKTVLFLLACDTTTPSLAALLKRYATTGELPHHVIVIALDEKLTYALRPCLEGEGLCEAGADGTVGTWRIARLF
jgi:hypothetical protein